MESRWKRGGMAWERVCWVYDISKATVFSEYSVGLNQSATQLMRSGRAGCSPISLRSYRDSSNAPTGSKSASVGCTRQYLDILFHEQRPKHLSRPHPFSVCRRCLWRRRSLDSLTNQVEGSVGQRIQRRDARSLRGRGREENAGWAEAIRLSKSQRRLDVKKASEDCEGLLGHAD